MFELLKFSFKSTFRKKGAAILTILGIAFGVGLMFSLNGLSEGLSVDINQEVQNAVGIIEIRQKNASQDFFSVLEPSSDTLIIENGPEKDRLISYSREIIFPFTTRDTSIDLGFSAAGNKCEYRYKGFAATQIINLNPQVDQIEEGRMYEDNKPECIIPDILYDNFPERLSIGKSIKFVLNNTDSISLEIVGIYRANIDPHLVNTIPLYDFYIGIEIAQLLQGEILLPNNINFHTISDNSVPDGYTVLILKYDSTEINDTIEIANQIKILLDSTYPNIEHQVYAKGSVIAPFEIIQSRVREFLVIISLITLVSGGMSIVIAQITNVEQRKKEFAILKSTGWKNVDVVHEVFLESLILSIIGGIFGLFIGFAGIGLIGTMFPTAAVVSLNTFIWWIIVVVGLGIIGGTSPAIKAVKAKPIEVLRSI